jgi:hypothetical protein
MKISDENKKILDILEVLLFDNNPIGLKVFPFLVFSKFHLKESDLKKLEVISVIKNLRLKNYLQKIPIDDFKNDATGEQEKFAQEYVKSLINLGFTPEKIVEDGEKMFEQHGLRMDDHDFDKAETVFQHKDIDKQIGDTFEEDILKQQFITTDRIIGDLYKLIEDLKNGRKWNDIKINYQDLIYNPKTTELFLLDEEPIKISKYSLSKNQHSKVLKALFENGKDKEHKFLDLMEQKVLPKKITSSDYYKICQEINKKKVAKATKNRIADFLLFSMDSVQINPKYSKKLHQLTLQIT